MKFVEVGDLNIQQKIFHSGPDKIAVEIQNEKLSNYLMQTFNRGSSIQAKILQPQISHL